MMLPFTIRLASTVALLFLLLTAGAAAKDLLSSTSKPIVAPCLDQQFDVFYDKTMGHYSLELVLSNRCDVPLELHYATGAKCDFLLLHGNSIVWSYNINRFFLQTEEVLTIAPQGSERITAQWDATEFGDMGLLPGEYRFLCRHQRSSGTENILSSPVSMPVNEVNLATRERVLRGLAYLQDAGLLSSYATGIFNGTNPLTDEALLAAVLRLQEELSLHSDVAPHQLLLAAELHDLLTSDSASGARPWTELKQRMIENADFAQLMGFGLLGKSTRLYEDLPLTHFAYQGCAYFAERGMLDGYSEGHFSSGMILTRKDFAEAVTRLCQYFDSEGTESLSRPELCSYEGLKAEFADELESIELVFPAYGEIIQSFAITRPAVESQQRTGYWANRALDHFIRTGRLEGYAENFYSSGTELSRQQLAQGVRQLTTSVVTGELDSRELTEAERMLIEALVEEYATELGGLTWQ